ncbi:MAG: xanthine dehydrogenase family protein subunit M [Dehalococcoidia bacterium]|nr:xanthine dehydrogenase family protein subunit M [Dehalococcoidia bacterium]
MIKDFEYSAPGTLDEALSLISQYGEDGKIIAGGQSLLLLMRRKLVAPRYLVDIKGISSLDYINISENGDLNIGALTTHRAIETSREIQQKFRILSEMEENIAAVENRNWGSIGGNLCHADPVGDPSPVLVALNARLEIVSVRGERTVAVEDFARDRFYVNLAHDEILTEIQVPCPAPRTGSKYTKFSILEGSFALASVAMSVTLNAKSDICDDVRIALGAVNSTAMRAREAEEVLIGKEITDELLEKAGEVASGEADPIGDMRASAAYRKELVKVLVKRVGKEALLRAGKDSWEGSSAKSDGKVALLGRR